MFEPSEISRVFAVPIGADFSKTFVRGLKNRLAGTPPHDIADIDIFVSTGRAQRSLRDHFVNAGATLLPRFHLISDIANDPFGLCDLPKPAPSLRRRLQLGQLIRQLLKFDPDLAPVSATYDLATSLEALMDEIQGEGVDMSSVIDLDVGDLSAHWERSKKFLSILADHWDQNTLTDPQDRMRHVVETYERRWQTQPPTNPVLVVGSTGSRGETALFMRAVSHLPNGAVVLPGLDTELPTKVWHSFKSKGSTLDHPQAGLAKLLRIVDLSPEQLPLWHASETLNQQRNKLVSLALRPAPITDQWLADGPSLKPSLNTATQNIDLLEAATPKEEALAIATRLRHAAEHGIESVLISPNRDLTRRVSAALARWGIDADDSAGVPLQLSPPGIFLRLIASCFGTQLAPHKFLSLLKHTLSHSGTDRNNHILMSQQAETGRFEGNQVLRGGPPFVNFEILTGWAQNDPVKTVWAAWLRKTLEPLEAATKMDLSDWVQLHMQTAQMLADGPNEDGKGLVWDKAAGQAAKEALEQLRDQASFGGTMTASEYNALLRSVLNRELRPERQTANPLISIWGTLEARVQTKELVVLGGLNESVWPAKPSHDMWLNRDMRKQLGLLLPERRIGLSAHDFQQAIAASNVVLSRSARDGEAPSTPSRWLIRLTNLLEGLDGEGSQALEAMRERGKRWVEYAKRLDRPTQDSDPATRPSPMPPADARLKRLSVTQVQDLVRDPYAIYAKTILRLRKLDPLGKQADALERGNAIHSIMEEFVNQNKDALPANAVDVFLEVAQRVLEQEVPWPAAQRLWLARLASVAKWIVTNEAERRQKGRNIALEKSGEMIFEDLGFKLTVKADRIDMGETGLRLYDYKASKPPSAGDIEYFDKQLQLEAMIAANNGFDGLNDPSIEHMEYIGLGPDKIQTVVDLDDQTIQSVWDEFRKLIATYNDPAKGFTARDKVQFIRYDSDYDHLSRKGEWQDSDDPDPRPVP